MNIHFISIGGSIMHNLAIALHKNKHSISGSDDEIFDPARSRLEKHGLLPKKTGWNPEMIHKKLDFVILGMHARQDNPELIKARELNLKIYSFPEFIYEHAKNKKRIVIAGSHGKTTITSMIMHVMQKESFEFDYMVGSSVSGFEDSVRLSEHAPYMLIEGDEYLTSAMDHRPKFLWYKAHIALISGIAWDHMNVFPDFQVYKKQFADFLEQMDTGTHVFYDDNDTHIPYLISENLHLHYHPYNYPDYKLKDSCFYLKINEKSVRMDIQGAHNMLNMEGAACVCAQIGIAKSRFYSAIQDFRGAGKRLEKIFESDDVLAFRDFAHAPSKVKATLEGLHEQYPAKRITAILELHTFSSLNKKFLPEYKNSSHAAEDLILLINPHALKMKKLEMISTEELQRAFARDDLFHCQNKEDIDIVLKKQFQKNSILLFMSSGNFDNMDILSLIEKLRT
jgi:UDP-N-acetylmuramate: L-alanyl-gamma-D-glutamyl-meso-diaminopimelate ligase